MMIQNGDGTFTGGPLDVLCVLHDVTTGKYHPAFFEEAPMPGSVADVQDVKIVRLKSKMHHTGGFINLEEAHKSLDELCAQIRVTPENIWRKPREWGGEIGIVWLEENWKAKKD